jgi:hypothetical protein
MKKKALLTTVLACIAALALAAIADLNGKWKASLRDPDGNDHPLHLVFKVDGDKLTGTAQADGPALDIQEGKVTGSDFAFHVTDQDGNVIPIDGKYVAQGDSISLNFQDNGAKFHVTFTRDDK